MKKIMKDKILVKIVLAVAILSFTSPGFSVEKDVGRIMPTGKVSVFQGGKKVGEFSKEAPLPLDTLIASDGRCGVKMDNLYFVANDETLFSVIDKTDYRKLIIEKGTIYFGISGLSKTLIFKTPHGNFTTHEVMLNASTESGLLKGYVSVTSKDTVLGVIDGGSMLLSSIKGENMIGPGNQVLLAQLELGPGQAASGASLAPLVWVPPAILAGTLTLGQVIEDEKEVSPHK